jgi:hypothetical protein
MASMIFGHVSARQRFELPRRHPGWIADDATFPAAEGDVGDGALPSHPGGEGGDLVERDVGVIADAALGRAECDVVLDAIAGEDLDLAVVHQHGHETTICRFGCVRIARCRDRV